MNEIKERLKRLANDTGEQIIRIPFVKNENGEIVRQIPKKVVRPKKQEKREKPKVIIKVENIKKPERKNEKKELKEDYSPIEGDKSCIHFAYSLEETDYGWISICKLCGRRTEPLPCPIMSIKKLKMEECDELLKENCRNKYHKDGNLPCLKGI